MSYVTNSPNANLYSGKQTSEMDYLETYILPEWVYRAVTAKYNLVDIHDYSKLRSVLSLEDVASLEILRMQIMSRSFDGMSYGIQSFFTPDWRFNVSDRPILTEAGKTEIETTVSFLVRDENLIIRTLNRLKTLEDNSLRDVVCEVPLNPATEELPYRVVLVGRTLYICVKEGFLSHIENAEKKHAFLSHVLKSAYAVAPIATVNQSVWYELYLASLGAL